MIRRRRQSVDTDVRKQDFKVKQSRGDQGTFVPASVVVQTLYDQAPADQAKKAIPRAESVEPSRRATDANPNHREDFNSLVSAAMRKPELKD